MQRIVCPERDDWQETAKASGFVFHSLDGERYWDESAYYAFSLAEIEQGIEGVTAEIDAMCTELVNRAIADERYLRLLKIPESFWTLITASWKRRDPTLYGRIDLRFDGNGPAKLLEYNADTPTSLFEAAVFQWSWLEQAAERQIIPRDADQYNSIHERLIEAWRKVGAGRHLHLSGILSNVEDAGTLQYLEDVARQAGLDTTMLDIEQVGLRDNGAFVDTNERDIELAFKLYPWEWMFRETFGARLKGSSTRWIEPPWKSILSNKGILPLLWAMFPNHPNLLPAFFEDDPNAATARHILCPQADLLARGRQRLAGERRRSAGTARRALRRGRFHPPGAGAVAELLGSVSGARQLDRRRHAVRAVDPRGRKPDHRQHVTLHPSRDYLAPAEAILELMTLQAEPPGGGRHVAAAARNRLLRDARQELGADLLQVRRPPTFAAFQQRLGKCVEIERGASPVSRRPSRDGPSLPSGPRNSSDASGVSSDDRMCARSAVSPSARMTARSMIFSSSRTLPR